MRVAKKIFTPLILLIAINAGAEEDPAALTIPPPGYEQTFPIEEAILRWRQNHSLKIYNGRDAELGEYPWQVSLRAHIEDGPEVGVHFCGGAVLSEDWILTAAHCLYDRSGQIASDKISVAAGHVKLSDMSLKKIDHVYLHPNYFYVFAGDDIALIKLSTALEFSETVSAIDLATDSADPRAGITYSVAGWGYSGSDEENSPILQILDSIPHVDSGTCNLTLDLHEGILEKMVCAGQSAGGGAACENDSGGPLIDSGDADNQQVGIVSFRPVESACSRPQKYAVFTRISYYKDWIAECMQDAVSCATP